MSFSIAADVDAVAGSLRGLASSLNVERMIGPLVSVLRSLRVRRASAGGMVFSICTTSIKTFLDSWDRSDISLYAHWLDEPKQFVHIGRWPSHCEPRLKGSCLLKAITCNRGHSSGTYSGFFASTGFARNRNSNPASLRYGSSAGYLRCRIVLGRTEGWEKGNVTPVHFRLHSPECGQSCESYERRVVNVVRSAHRKHDGKLHHLKKVGDAM